MKFTPIEMKILETIEDEVRVRQNRLLDIIDEKSNETVSKYIKKLIKSNMIFSYIYGHNRYYELHPREAFYKDITTQIEYRIKDIVDMLKKIERQYVKYGPDVLDHVENVFSHYKYNPRYSRNRIYYRIEEYESFYDEAAYRKNVIKIISKMKNKKSLLNITNTAMIETHETCNELHSKLIALTRERNKMNISEERFTMDEMINLVVERYYKLHGQFYIFETYFDMQINDEQYTDDKSDDNNHSNTMKCVVEKNPIESIDMEYSNIHKEILKIIGNHDGISRQFLDEVLNKQRELRSFSTIIKYVDDLVEAGEIRVDKQGKKFTYYLSDDIRTITSKKQIREIIKEWRSILSQISQELSEHDISIQIGVLDYLNRFFKQLQQFLTRFKEYDKHEIIVDYEKRINETFGTICTQTNIEKLLKLVVEKFDQISDIVDRIGDTSENFLLSNEPISSRLKNLSNKLEKNKIELDELYHKKINYDDLETTKFFDSIIKDIDSIAHMVLDRPIKNRDEFNRTIRRTKMSLSYKHKIDLSSIKENIITLKTDMLKNNSYENARLDKIKNQLLSLCKHSEKYKSIEKLILNF